jgi:aspartyl protease family protein
MDSRHSIASIALGLLVSTGAAATDITVVGLFPNKAVVQIDGGTLQTLSVGQKTSTGITLTSVDRDGATFDIQGKPTTLKMGQHHASRSTSSAASVVLNADTRGHFVTDGQINGVPIRFIVDTGATVISIPASEARRMALDFRKGQTVMMNTANGATAAYLIKLDTVRVGDVTVNNVDAVVMEAASLPAALLGMSFLNRMDMKREGGTMTLTRRY